MSQPTHIRGLSLSYTYPGAAAPVFSGVSLSLSRGWTAVLGDNGIGKTTLMRIVTGDLRPEQGSVTPDPSDMAIAFCPQRIDTPPWGLERFAEDWSPQTMNVRRVLGIDDDWPYRYATLSGGEAKRLQIACALTMRPDLLVLDEPTNHVDEPTRRAIVATLRGYRGIGVIISHDPGIIDAVCRHCVWMRRRHIGGANVTVVETYAGGYTEGLQRLEDADRRSEVILRRTTAERTRLRAVRDQRFHAVQRSEGIKRQGALIDPHDHDALQRRRDAKASSTDGHSARSYARMVQRVDRIEHRIEGIGTAAKRYDADIWFESHVSTRRELARLGPGVLMFGGARVMPSSPSMSQDDDMTRQGQYSKLVIDSRRADLHGTPLDAGGTGYVDGVKRRDDAESGRPLGIRIPTLSIGPHDHIGVSGPNGLGKTTLIHALASVLVDVPRLLVDQTLPVTAAAQALDRLRQLRPESRSRVLQAYAQLNSDPDTLLRPRASEPSPGELRKLLLCLGIVDDPELIIMDEPTNHLDLGSQRALAKALRGAPGAVVLVSHERWFLDATTDIRWSVERI